MTKLNSLRSTLLSTSRVPDDVASILKSAGGKHAFSPKVPALAPFKVTEFREPFASSAACLFAMIRSDRCERAWLNDLDPDIYRFWTVMQKHHEGLMLELYALHDRFGLGSYEMFDLACQMVKSDNKIEAAAGFYVRNHLSRSGTNGKSGFNPSYPRDGRGIKRHLINYIPQFSAWLQRARITNLDYREVLDAPGENVFALLDPAYDVVGKTMYPFGDEDLAELAQRVRVSPHSCLVTVDDSPPNRVLFSDMSPIVRRYASSMGNHHSASELICANYTTPLYDIHARDIGVPPMPAHANDNPGLESDAPIEQVVAPKKRKSRVMFSSKTDQWFSPPALMEALYKAFDVEHFDLDPCSPPEGIATTKAARRFSLELGHDGLKLPWLGGLIYMNPPYGKQIPHWLKKAKAEVANGNARTIVGLLPVRTNTLWWHHHVANDARLQWMIRGRLRFGDAKWDAPFSSVLVCWGDIAPFERALDNGLEKSVPGYLIKTKENF